MRLPLLVGVTLLTELHAVGQTLIDLRSQVKNVDFSGAVSTKPFRAGLILPVTCNVSEAFLNLSAIPGQNLFICTATNVWTAQAPLPSTTGNSGTVLTNDGITAQWRALGGDLSGNPAAAVVNRIRGRLVNPATPLPGQILRWDESENQWSAAGESLNSVFGRTGTVVAQANDYDFSQISGTLSLSKGGTGATTAASALSNLGAAAVSHSHALTDLAGISGKQGSAEIVQMFGGGPVNADECAKFDGAGNLISTGEPCGSVPNYGQSFTSAISVPMTHNLHSTNLLVQCYDMSNTAIGFNSFVVETADRATVTFVNPQSGRCVLNASSGSRSVEGVTNLTTPLTLDQPVFGNSGSDLKSGSKTGTGNQVVVSQSPVITAPYITDFTNMQHDHSGRAAGGQLTISAISPSALTGNGGALATTAGPMVAGNCAQIDANGNITAAGAPCGTGAGAGGPVISGLGLTGAGTADSPLSIDANTVGARLTGTATLDFGTINGSACSEMTVPLSGATTGDEVFLGAPADIDPGFVWSGYASSNNTITVRLCKVTAGSVHPVARAWRATVIRSF